jgi:hypothetical protein
MVKIKHISLLLKIGWGQWTPQVALGSAHVVDRSITELVRNKGGIRSPRVQLPFSTHEQYEFEAPFITLRISS